MASATCAPAGRTGLNDLFAERSRGMLDLLAGHGGRALNFGLRRLNLLLSLLARVLECGLALSLQRSICFSRSARIWARAARSFSS